MTSDDNEPVHAMLDLHVPATVDGMETVHNALAGYCETLRQTRTMESRWSDEFTLAVAEVAANIIQHASDPDAPLVQFSLSLTQYPDRLVARFVDRGIVLVPPESTAMPSVLPSYMELNERGRGLALVQATTDRFEYQRRPNGENVWIIEKDFPE